MMKTHSTNYYNTFIAVAGDCKAASGEAPPAKEPVPDSTTSSSNSLPDVLAAQLPSGPVKPRKLRIEPGQVY